MSFHSQFITETYSVDESLMSLTMMIIQKLFNRQLLTSFNQWIAFWIISRSSGVMMIYFNNNNKKLFITSNSQQINLKNLEFLNKFKLILLVSFLLKILLVSFFLILLVSFFILLVSFFKNYFWLIKLT